MSSTTPVSTLRSRLLLGQAGEVSVLTLAIILIAPLVILGALVFVLIIAYLNRVSRVTAELEAKRKPAVCPACSHKLVEIRNFCAECGAPIRPSEPVEPEPAETSPEEPA